MSILDIFKKKKKQDKEKKAAIKEKKVEKTVAKDKKEEYSSLKPKVGGLETAPLKSVKEKTDKKIKKENTKDAYKILLRPLVTEKATDLVAQNKYSFEVAKFANKITVAKAIKSLYGMDPVDVNIINMRGKRVTYGRIRGKKKNWKKAIITLKQGDKIELYEGV